MSQVLRAVQGRLRRLRRRVLLHRRLLAALAAGAAVFAGLQAAAPPVGETVTVWTAGRDLPGGAVLQASDLTSVSFPPDIVPDDAVRDPARVIGRTLAAPMSRGEVLTGLRAVTRGLLRGYPGQTAVPLRITDADIVDLLHVGDRLSIVVADPDGRHPPRLLLEGVPVVAIPQQQGRSLGAGTPGRLVVVAVPAADASDVAASAATSILIPVWSR